MPNGNNVLYFCVLWLQPLTKNLKAVQDEFQEKLYAISEDFHVYEFCYFSACVSSRAQTFFPSEMNGKRRGVKNLSKFVKKWHYSVKYIVKICQKLSNIFSRSLPRRGKGELVVVGWGGKGEEETAD